MLRRAARARRSACKRRRGALPPRTPVSRAKPAAAAIRRKRHRQNPIAVLHTSALPKRQASRAPLSAPHPSDAHAARACFALGSPRASCSATCRGLRGTRLRFPQTVSTCTPAPQPPCHSLPEGASFLPSGPRSGRQLRLKAELPHRTSCGSRCPLLRPAARRTLRQFAAPSALSAGLPPPRMSGDAPSSPCARFCHHFHCRFDDSDSR